MKGTLQIGGYALLGLFLLLALFSLVGPLQDSPGEANLYALQADAFLHGRFDLPQHYHDTAVFEGRYYVPFPPFPALLVTPIVALFGLHNTNMVLVSLLLALATGRVCWRILQRLAIPRSTAAWLIAAFFLGTSYWGSVHMSRGVWFTAHIVSAWMLLLYRRGAVGGGARPLSGSVLLSRQFNVLYPSMLAPLVAGAGAHAAPLDQGVAGGGVLWAWFIWFNCGWQPSTSARPPAAWRKGRARVKQGPLADACLVNPTTWVA